MPNDFQRPVHSNQSGLRGGNRNSDTRPEQTLIQLWPGYLKDGYFDSSSHLRLEYVSREKVEPLAQEMVNAYPKLTTNQLRRFFGHCRAIETNLRSLSGMEATDRWADVAPSLHKLDIAASDGYGKVDKKFPKIFHDFIQKNVAACKTENDFLHGFIPHFEALVGFGSQYFDRETR